MERRQTFEIDGEGSVEVLPYNEDSRVRITKSYSCEMLQAAAITLSKKEAVELAKRIMEWADV